MIKREDFEKLKKENELLQVGTKAALKANQELQEKYDRMLKLQQLTGEASQKNYMALKAIMEAMEAGKKANEAIGHFNAGIKLATAKMWVHSEWKQTNPELAA